MLLSLFTVSAETAVSRENQGRFLYWKNISMEELQASLHFVCILETTWVKGSPILKCIFNNDGLFSFLNLNFMAEWK